MDRAPACSRLLAAAVLAPVAAAAASYTNPVLDRDFPDPAVIRARNGTFFAYATGTILRTTANVQLATSSDLVHWRYLEGALSSGKNLAWGDGRMFWAPDVTLQHWGGRDRYLMYYAGQSRETKAQRMCIGAALADAPEGPFEDVGEPLVCRDGYVAIDPKRVDVGGHSYLFWGSGHNGSIFRTPVEPQGWRFVAGARTEVVLPSDLSALYEKTVEGAWVDYDAQAPGGPTWWLYYSGSNCCGAAACYSASVARAGVLGGKFMKKADAKGSQTSAVLEGLTGPFQAPGHNSIIRDDAGDTWMLYHAFPGKDRSRRVLMLDRVVYRDGFPWVGMPSSRSMPAPRTQPTRFV